MTLDEPAIAPSADAAAPAAYAAADMQGFASAVFQHAGMNPEQAGILAEHLVWADLHGNPSHGMRKVLQYVARIRHGGTKAVGRPSDVREYGAMTTVDADDTFGQVVGVDAMERAVTKAREHGVGITIVRNTTSAGALGRYAMIAVEHGMIGFAINNGPPLQPVWGSAEKVIGNQAFAIASPAGNHPPLVLDMATSAITLARVREHQASGTPLPPGVAMDAEGNPTVDPAAALQGLLLPTGGHRGSGLSIMWEVLTGVLSGGDRFLADLTMPDVYDRPQGVSLFFMAINPEVLMPRDAFLARVDRLIDQVHAARPAPGFDGVRVPGEHSHALAEERRRTGIVLESDLVVELEKLGAELGVAWPG